MAKSKKRGGLGVAFMYAFGRGAGKKMASTSISPYRQCSEILEGMGHPRLSGEAAKKHCFRCEAVMRETAKGHYKKPSVCTTPKRDYVPVVPDDFRVAGVSVVSDAFLQTYEWRRVRMMALKKYGSVCMCCGDSPANGAVMNVDHIKPRKLFPQLALDLDNLQVLCGPCNHGKGNWDMTDWREQEDPPELIRLVRDICA